MKILALLGLAVTRAAKSQSIGVYDYPVSLNPDQAYLDWDNIGYRIAVLSEAIPADQLICRGPFLTCTSPESHIGPYKHAIDFLVPDGTPVLATADGVITNVVENHTQWGLTKAWAHMLNYVTIRHEYPEGVEFSQYCHLGPRSVSNVGLEVGNEVKRGQIISTVWKTGWTDRDHLHFIVFKSSGNESGFESLPVRFRPVELEEKQFYYDD